MIKIKTVVLFLVFFLFANGIHAQQIKHLDNNNGLINGTINTFEKDSLGYFWIGTDQGLNRFSGVEFKTYNLEKFSKSKGNGIVKVINLNGDLYMIGTNGFLFKYLYEFDRLEVICSMKEVRFLSLASLNKNQLLIGLSAGFIIFDLKTKQSSKVLHPELLNNRSVHFFNGKVYAATSRGVYVFDYQEKL